MSALFVSRLVKPASKLSVPVLRRTLQLQPRRFFASTPRAHNAQSASPLGPIGVEAALKAAEDPSFKPRLTLQKEFDLTGRVAVVSGGNRGLGLEMAEALCEAGAIVYCLDLPSEPGKEWTATRDYVKRIGLETGRLEYVSVDVTDQQTVWDVVENIANKEKRMDVCIAAAGILNKETDCLEYRAKDLQRVLNVNINGVMYTAQAAGRQMARFGTPGSIILIASMSGSITNKVIRFVSVYTAFLDFTEFSLFVPGPCVGFIQFE